MATLLHIIRFVSGTYVK